MASYFKNKSNVKLLNSPIIALSSKPHSNVFLKNNNQ